MSHPSYTTIARSLSRMRTTSASGRKTPFAYAAQHCDEPYDAIALMATLGNFDIKVDERTTLIDLLGKNTKTSPEQSMKAWKFLETQRALAAPDDLAESSESSGAVPNNSNNRGPDSEYYNYKRSSSSNCSVQ